MVLAIASCSERKENEDIILEIKEGLDSAEFIVRLGIRSGIGKTADSIRSLDLLVYSGGDLMELETHIVLKRLEDTIRFRSTEGTKMAVALANITDRIDLRKLSRYGIAESLTVEFDDDDPDCPMMSAVTTLQPGEENGMRLQPLMGRIVLRNVTNGIGSYTRLEEPRVYLDGIETTAELLRTDGFRPSGNTADSRTEHLSYDIGLFPQEACISLFCYPNSCEAEGLGSVPTRLMFECEIKGSTCIFPVTVTPLERNSTIYVDMEVTSASEFSYTISR